MAANSTDAWASTLSPWCPAFLSGDFRPASSACRCGDQSEGSLATYRLDVPKSGGLRSGDLGQQTVLSTNYPGQVPLPGQARPGWDHPSTDTIKQTVKIKTLDLGR